MSSPDMSLDSSPQSSSSPRSQEPNPQSHITTLNEIDTSISSLLTSASLAIQILSGTLPPSSEPPSLSHLQSTFTSSATTYFSTLSSIEVRLRRQVYALEEAGLIPAGDERDARRGRNLAYEAGMLGGRASGSGGSGPLDASWLNARIDNGVEGMKRRELLGEGRRFVEEMRNGEGEQGGEGGSAG